MSADPKLLFPHRHNKNGSHDAICAICYMTVDSQDIEVDLRRLEATHVCSPERIFEMSQKIVRPA
jgi:hypothetical protein